MSEPDRGMYDALNKGLALFQGDAMGVFNADDRYNSPHVLSLITEALQSHDATHGNRDFHDEDGRVVRRWRAAPRPSRGFAAGWMLAHPTFYVRRHVAEAVGPFDTKLATAADYEWMLRVIDIHGTNLNHIPDVMIDMALGGRSTESLSSHVKHNFEALAATRKLADTRRLNALGWNGARPLHQGLAETYAAWLKSLQPGLPTQSRMRGGVTAV